MEYCGERGEAPACGVFCEATRARRRSNGGCGEAPARCVIAVVTARQPARGPDSVVLALSDGVWWGQRLLAAAVGGRRGTYLGDCRRAVARTGRRRRDGTTSANCTDETTSVT